MTAESKRRSAGQESSTASINCDAQHKVVVLSVALEDACRGGKKKERKKETDKDKTFRLRWARSIIASSLGFSLLFSFFLSLHFPFTVSPCSPSFRVPVAVCPYFPPPDRPPLCSISTHPFIPLSLISTSLSISPLISLRLL